ncbi:extracellular solute-binding protein [Phototrophicus methaneseepsis]|uniref:Extracellular solute-binding protein n=1 Tax=Phototrophicus methaneseepsis TaxID=2710758 RepID=A0A7S8E6K4_9CHLR|nr:extracellular solute-binding protein [Phototrophicus methaneseepsis]QPC81292.1 extracellular solute-binding protein [Phototrophicus methaneseepsis]
MRNNRSISLFTIISILIALTFGSVQAQEPVQIRWYVGLGAGTDAPLVEAQQAIVDEFNASQSDIVVTLEIVDNDQAYDVLSTQIAAGNAPDIIGPMGIRGRASYPGAWLDLEPLIESTSYDLSDFDEALVDSYYIEGEGQLGIPFAVYPSFMLYNKELFDEAGIPYPPSEYGEPYVDWEGNEREWNIETMSEIAKILTVDGEGNDATMEEFNTEDVVQFGYATMMTDVRGRDTLFGAGNFVDEEGNAVIPENWREAEHWFHNAMWEEYYVPNAVYGTSELMGGSSGNPFNTGNLGMGTIHVWYLGWGTADLDAEWDFAPVPSYNGTATAKLHSDTFGILNTTDHPEEAFTVLSYLLGEKAQELTALYGGMPARLSLQESYFENLISTLSDGYPNTDWASKNWDVVVAGLSYPDNPNHEEGMPAFLEASARYGEYSQFVDNNADADVDAELDKLRDDLQAIFDAAADQ